MHSRRPIGGLSPGCMTSWPKMHVNVVLHHSDILHLGILRAVTAICLPDRPGLYEQTSSRPKGLLVVIYAIELRLFHAIELRVFDAHSAIIYALRMPMRESKTELSVLSILHIQTRA